MSSSTTQTTANRRHIYRLTNQILNNNSLHFILLSLLFIPATFSASAAFKLYSSGGTHVTTTEFDPFNLLVIKTILASSQTLTLTTLIAFACFVLLTVAGVALITYSTNQIIHNKPVTFTSTIKSLSYSYFPLLHTLIAGSVTPIVIFLAITAVNEAVNALGFHFGLLFVPIVINSIVSYALAITIVFFIVSWGSAPAITVLESKSGFQSLRQSANQSVEFRRHSFSIVFVTGFGAGTALVYSTVPQQANWTSILQVGGMYVQLSLMILMYVVANTVLYVQGKVASGEEIVKTAVEGEVSGEFVTLIVNNRDGEVLHEPEVENGGFNYMVYLLTMVWVILLCVQLYYLFIIL